MEHRLKLGEPFERSVGARALRRGRRSRSLYRLAVALRRDGLHLQRDDLLGELTLGLRRERVLMAA